MSATRAPAPESAADVRAARMWLAGLVAVGLAVRLIGLNSGLWVDEIYSLLGSFRPPLSEIVTVFPRDNQHPLYSVLAHVSLTWFGEAPWVIRIPAALFGVATIPMLYLLGTQVTTRREALLAAALLTVSYHHVWFSQNARGYSALAFFATLASYLFLRGLARGEPWVFVGYGAAAALGAYTHLTMIFVVVSHMLLLLILLLRRSRERQSQVRDWRLALAGFALAGVVTLLLYAPILGQVQEYFVNKPSGLKGVSTPAWAFGEALRVLQTGLGTGVAGAAALAAAVILFGFGLWSYYRENPLALALFLLPGLVTILGALVARGTMYPRFFFSLIGFGILIGVRGSMVVARVVARHLASGAVAERLALWGGTAAVAAMIALSSASLLYNYRYPKQDFGGAQAFVEERRQPGDEIVTTGVASLPYRSYYGLPWPSIDSVSQLQAVRHRSRLVWVVYTFPRYLERSAPEIMAAIRRECAVAGVFPGTVGGGDLVVCTMGPMSVTAGSA